MAEDESAHLDLEPHVWYTLLLELRQKVDVKPHSRGSASFNEIFFEGVCSAWVRRCCPRHSKEVLQVAKDALFKDMEPRLFSAKMTQRIGQLGVMAMELLSAEASRLLVPLVGPWMSAAQRVVMLVSYCTPDMVHHITHTHHTIQWIRSVFCDRHVCPSPYLALEMIRFMMAWPSCVLRDHRLGLDVVHALPHLGCHLALQDMLPRGRPSLSGPLACLLLNLHRAGLLYHITCKVFTQVTGLNISHEARFYAHVVKLLGEKAKALRHLCHKAAFSAPVVLQEYKHLLATLEVLVVSDSCKVAFRLPGLVQVAAMTIGATAISLYKCWLSVAAASEDCFRTLTTQLNQVLSKVRQENHILGKELLTHHGKSLAKAARLGEHLGFPLHYLNLTPHEEQVPPDYPECYFDPVTGRLMEQPVCLVSLGHVVDMSTMVGLMLFSSDRPPFTHQPGLHHFVNLWRVDPRRPPRQGRHRHPRRQVAAAMTVYDIEPVDVAAWR